MNQSPDTLHFDTAVSSEIQIGITWLFEDQTFGSIFDSNVNMQMRPLVPCFPENGVSLSGHKL